VKQHCSKRLQRRSISRTHGDDLGDAAACVSFVVTDRDRPIFTDSFHRGWTIHLKTKHMQCNKLVCSSKIQIGFTFVVPAHLGSPRQRAIDNNEACSATNLYVHYTDQQSHCLVNQHLCEQQIITFGKCHGRVQTCRPVGACVACRWSRSAACVVVVGAEPAQHVYRLTWGGDL